MLMYLLLVFGTVLSSVMGLLPLQSQIGIPDAFRFMMFGLGVTLSFTGVILLHLRTLKLGVNHLINPGNPKNILWLYVFRDGTIKVTPSIRVVESQLYSKEIDAQIHEMRSYRWHDHSVRFVPEGLGHAVDLDMCLYASVLKTKYGISSIREARKRFFNLLKQVKSYESQENITSGESLDQVYQNILDHEKEMKKKVSKGDVVGSATK